MLNVPMVTYRRTRRSGSAKMVARAMNIGKATDTNLVKETNVPLTAGTTARTQAHRNQLLSSLHIRGSIVTHRTNTTRSKRDPLNSCQLVGVRKPITNLGKLN